MRHVLAQALSQESTFQELISVRLLAREFFVSSETEPTHRESAEPTRGRTAQVIPFPKR